MLPTVCLPFLGKKGDRNCGRSPLEPCGTAAQNLSNTAPKERQLHAVSNGSSSRPTPSLLCSCGLPVAGDVFVSDRSSDMNRHGTGS